MADGFESYHVPQQSRRDKLRVLAHDAAAAAGFHGGCAGFFPLYSPSLLTPPDYSLTYAGGAALDFHRHHHYDHNATHLGGACDTNAAKEEGANLAMCGYGGVNGGLNIVTNIDASITSNHGNYCSDLQSSIPMNPPPIQEINGNHHPYLYAPQNPRNYDHIQSYNGASLTLNRRRDSSAAGTAQGLSLSLSSSQGNRSSSQQMNPPPPPRALNLEKYESPASTIFPDIAPMGSASVGPLVPFTGYTLILKGSRFLEPAQQLLEEVCNVGRGIHGHKAAEAIDSPAECFGDLAVINDNGDDCGGRKKPRLISILEEVCRRYKQCYQQLQAVVASFESVPGLSNAAPYANLALKAMCKHFRSLKNALTDQLQLTTKTHGHIGYGKEGSQRIGDTDRGLYSQRTVQPSGAIGHQPVWRTQRGLPERAVTVLRAWLFEHFLHPYPSDGDKLLLAKQTGLSRNQVSNWFINARVRLWKPMVEEIHMLEARQAKATAQRDAPWTNAPDEQLPSPHSLASENPSTSSAPSILDTQYEGSAEELVNLPYGGSTNSARDEPPVAGAARGGSNVSLTLGLHKGIGLSQAFPVEPARRFGLSLDANAGGYAMAGGGGFEGQNRGQLLRDFVG